MVPRFRAISCTIRLPLVEKVAMRRCTILALLLVSCVARQSIHAQTVSDSNAGSGSSANSASAAPSDPAPSNPAGNDYSLNWLFPVHKLNQHLPSWIHVGGEYRGRIEGPTGIWFTGT